MNHVLLLLPAVLLQAVATAAPVPKAKPAESYFPTAVGTKWVYQRESGELITEEVTELDEKKGEVRVVFRVSQNGSSWKEDYTVSGTEVVMRTILDQYKLDIRLLQLPLTAKDKWEFEIPVQKGLKADAGTTVVGKAEMIEVPAGKFEAVPVVSETTAVDGKQIAKTETCTRWYAPGIGLVKIEYNGGHRVLKEFTPAKK